MGVNHKSHVSQPPSLTGESSQEHFHIRNWEGFRVYVELFTLLENIEYCLPDNITVVHDNVKKTVKIMYNNNKVYILLPNVTEVRHVTDFLIWYLSQLHLHYSTYKVQDVSVTGDSYKKTLQCHFLDGTEHDTCFIEVEGDDRPLSGSDVYHFSKPGNHTLRVYDNRAQRDAGAEPAKVLNITIGDVQTEENGEGFTWVIIVGVVLLPVFLLAVIGLLLYCTLRKHACNEVPTRNEDEAEHGSGSNDSQQHGSAVDDIANVVHQATAPEEGKDDLEIGIGEIVITAVGIRNRQRVPAHHRSNENHVAIRIEEECNNKSIKDLPTTEGQQVSSDAEKEVEVTVEGLEIPELHQGPVEENIN
ncbi:hypothetical protein GBAR_LOCUS5344 [Geodia barretti]|uniref:Uncharacterized protein n=1 Tax=Geodia barretti TaxID=519541 RepID=A0AA35W4D8_GEOBA|nr:hypothetical protein GBAR_LOCUS5344 [Geodia barretti]